MASNQAMWLVGAKTWTLSGHRNKTCTVKQNNRKKEDKKRGWEKESERR